MIRQLLVITLDMLYLIQLDICYYMEVTSILETTRVQFYFVITKTHLRDSNKLIQVFFFVIYGYEFSLMVEHRLLANQAPGQHLNS